MEYLHSISQKEKKKLKIVQTHINKILGFNFIAVFLKTKSDTFIMQKRNTRQINTHKTKQNQKFA